MDYKRTYHPVSRLQPLAVAVLLLAAVLSIFSSCKKDDDDPPAISLRSGGDYTADKSVVAVGAPLKFGITATTGDANITNLVVKKILPDGDVRVVLDSGMNSAGFSLDRIFFQNIEDTAQWTFQVMDKNRLFATAHLIIYKDSLSAWGGIYEYYNITLGYQDNTQYGHFFCPATGAVYGEDSASFHAAGIDLAVYYFVDDNLPSPTFSSPGEQGWGVFDYYPYISGWTVKNYTKYDISVETDPIPVVAFDACHNDSLLIVSYDEVWGKKKYKWADPGEVLPFLTAHGKKGLIRVISADHQADGVITFNLKIQQ